MKNRKILVISHNVFDRRTNMGKTLSGFFTDWNPDRLAQLYLHSEIPTSDICHKYYRITDTDALKSVPERMRCEYVLYRFKERFEQFRQKG